MGHETLFESCSATLLIHLLCVTGFSFIPFLSPVAQLLLYLLQSFPFLNALLMQP